MGAGVPVGLGVNDGPSGFMVICGPGFALTVETAGVAGEPAEPFHTLHAVTDTAAISRITSAKMRAGTVFLDIFLSPLKELQ